MDVESILIPTDGSDGALAGAKQGLALAEATGAEVAVLSVVEESAADRAESTADLEADALEDEVEAAVDEVAALAAETGLEVTTAVERGDPPRVVASYVDEHGIDVVAMGTHGRAGLERVLLGSVTEHVLRTVSVPVLATPPDGDDRPLEYEDVLLPTDGSEGATAAVDWGIALASAFDAMVHALYSVDTGYTAGRKEVEELFAGLEAEGEAALETVRERAREAGVSVTATLASGRPERVIESYVEEDGIDLVVMGTRGRGGVEQHLLGSVTENVLRSVAVPVLCVPLPAGETEAEERS